MARLRRPSVSKSLRRERGMTTNGMGAALRFQMNSGRHRSPEREAAVTSLPDRADYRVRDGRNGSPCGWWKLPDKAHVGTPQLGGRDMRAEVDERKRVQVRLHGGAERQLHQGL